MGGPEQRTWKFQSFYHTIINARDVDETIAFYELLGFEILDDRRSTVWPDDQGAFFGLIPDIKGRAALMRLPADPNGPMLDIIEWQVPRVDFPARSPEVVPRVLAFRVENVKAAFQELRALGVTFTKPQPNEMPEVGIVASAACEDPNGNLIEIIELEPGLRHSKIGTVYREDEG
jgi:catechol 2,3-dioxygenase-like lactoylglutathione lyase family enzyme